MCKEREREARKRYRTRINRFFNVAACFPDLAHPVHFFPPPRRSDIYFPPHFIHPPPFTRAARRRDSINDKVQSGRT